ncbi:MAG: hypothetical protein RIS70_1318, partial [Planctomycetota bacterium]
MGVGVCGVSMRAAMQILQAIRAFIPPLLERGFTLLFDEHDFLEHRIAALRYESATIAIFGRSPDARVGILIAKGVNP